MLKLFRPKVLDEAPPSVGEKRVYAIGDIHGRADLFEELLHRIVQDDATRDRLPVHIILLGDLVDRGPQSAAVVQRALDMADLGGDIRFLKGNHEEVFVAAARGDPRAARFFCRIGGMETLASYGLDEAVCTAMDDEEIAAWMLTHVPRAHVDFVESFEDMTEIGDYLFVHAGIRPNIPVANQNPSDLRWIREPFLNHETSHGRMVVHGHSITEDVDIRHNRIGIDTGAYVSGRLTALGLEGSDRWFLQTGS